MRFLIKLTFFFAFLYSGYSYGFNCAAEVVTQVKNNFQKTEQISEVLSKGRKFELALKAHTLHFYVLGSVNTFLSQDRFCEAFYVARFFNMHAVYLAAGDYGDTAKNLATFNKYIGYINSQSSKFLHETVLEYQKGINSNFEKILKFGLKPKAGSKT